MEFLNSFKSFLRGNYTCIKCGKVYNSLGFGHGQFICPSCYTGEDSSLELDNSPFNNLLPKYTEKNFLLNTKESEYKETLKILKIIKDGLEIPREITLTMNETQRIIRNLLKNRYINVVETDNILRYSITKKGLNVLNYEEKKELVKSSQTLHVKS
jgi:hypothetical protein